MIRTHLPMCMVAISTVWAAACSETLESPSVRETSRARFVFAAAKCENHG